MMFTLQKEKKEKQNSHSVHITFIIRQKLVWHRQAMHYTAINHLLSLTTYTYIHTYRFPQNIFLVKSQMIS